MTTTVVAAGDYTLEVDTGAPVQGFRLDDPVRGILDGTTYVLDGLTDFADITPYTLNISIDRGRQRTADQFGAGTMTVTLNDTAAGGVFNPFANDGPYYDPTNELPGIAPMRLIRLKRENQYLFIGRIVDFDYTFDISGQDTVTLACADDLYLLAQTPVDAVSTSKELSGARIEAILDLPEVDYPTGAARNIATGTVEIGGGGDYNVELGVTPIQYFQLINQAEQGRLFITNDGVLTFEERIGATLSGSVADFHDDGTNLPYRGLDIDFGADQVINRVVINTLNNKTATAEDLTSQADYFIQTLVIDGSLLDTQGDVDDLADYLLQPEPEARFTRVEVGFEQLTDGQRDTVAAIDIGATITIEKSFLNGGVTTELAQELAVEGISHYINYATGHTVQLYTSQTTIVFELILDDPTYGTLDGENVLG
jgi:hypothetical protein